MLSFNFEKTVNFLISSFLDDLDEFPQRMLDASDENSDKCREPRRTSPPETPFEPECVLDKDPNEFSLKKSESFEDSDSDLIETD